MPFGYDSSFDIVSLETLTEPGVTSAQKTTGAALSIQATISGVGTNVVIRFEGSLDGEGFFNLGTGGNDYTITSDGVYGYALYTPVQYIRARFVSASGGSPSVSMIFGTA